MGVILANFDCELAWARQHTPGPHNELPDPVRKALAKAASLLEVFARPGDILWRLTDPAITPEGPALFWGQTLATRTHTAPPELAPSKSWQEALWRLGCSSSIAARCNHRAFALEIPVDPRRSLPEIVQLRTLEDLDHYIKNCALGPDTSWVAKAPFSASGRERLRRRGRALEGEERVRAARLLSRYGSLLVEPWMPRTADYGCSGLVFDTREELLVFPAHRLHSDATGVFRGIEIADRRIAETLGPTFASALELTAKSTGLALHDAGYRGPFGIDAFTYRDHQGQERLQALCEINARLSFGLVARAMAESLGRDEFVFRL